MGAVNDGLNKLDKISKLVTYFYFYCMMIGVIYF